MPESTYPALRFRTNGRVFLEQMVGYLWGKGPIPKMILWE